MDTSPCSDPSKPAFRLNGCREGSHTSDVAPGKAQEVSDRGSRAVEYLNHCGAISPEQEDLNTDDAPCALDRSGWNHVSTSASESQDCSLERVIIKHKPSAIVFCDHDRTSDAQLMFATETSDTGGSSSSVSEEEECDNDNEDDFPETLRYKEFLVSHHQRNLSRNRTVLRNRQDAHPEGIASSWRKPTNGSQPEPTQEEQEYRLNGGKQVRQTRPEAISRRSSPDIFLLPITCCVHML